jgi:hypothetical protein
MKNSVPDRAKSATCAAAQAGISLRDLDTTIWETSVRGA